MKKYKIIAFLLPVLFFADCKLAIIDDLNGITQEKTVDGKGPLYLLAGALKAGFEAHNQICWSAGLDWQRRDFIYLCQHQSNAHSD